MAKLKQCKACGKTISKNAKVCPECGQRNAGGCLKVLGIGIGIILFLVILGAIFGDKTPKEDKAAKQIEEQAKKYEILEEKIEGDQYTRYVVGKIKNNSGKDRSYLQIEINLYDKDGNQTGSTMDNINNLEKDGIWSFKAMIFDEKATSYKIKEVTGF